MIFMECEWSCNKLTGKFPRSSDMICVAKIYYLAFKENFYSNILDLRLEHFATDLYKFIL